MENVLGFLSTRMPTSQGSVLAEIIRWVSRLGYHFSFRKLDASEHDVP
jgi:site-specific DNA-cytosine methylase